MKRSSNDAGKRVWDKEHACMYCSKTFTYITKHYFRKHKTEKDVIEIKSQPLGSKQRAKLLLLLRNKGDFNYSHEALRTNSGRVIPVRRPVRGKPEHDMVPCEHCFGMFNKHALWRHDKTCRLKPAGCGSDAPSKRRRLVAASSMLLPATQGIHEGLRKNVLNNMLGDAISLCAKNDSLIVKSGTKMYEKLGHKRHLHTYISQKMRELARFVLAIREVDSSIVDLSDCMTARKFPSILKAVRQLCKYNDNEKKYGIPSLALKIGHALKKCVRIHRSEARIAGTDGVDVDELTALCDEEWIDDRRAFNSVSGIDSPSVTGQSPSAAGQSHSVAGQSHSVADSVTGQSHSLAAEKKPLKGKT